MRVDEIFDDDPDLEFLEDDEDEDSVIDEIHVIQEIKKDTEDQ